VWWYDEAKAERLTAAMQSDDSLTLDDSDAAEIGDAPANGESPLRKFGIAAIGLLLVLWFFNRRRGSRQPRVSHP
jgi:hypothetical protein